MPISNQPTGPFFLTAAAKAVFADATFFVDLGLVVLAAASLVTLGLAGAFVTVVLIVALVDLGVTAAATGSARILSAPGVV